MYCTTCGSDINDKAVVCPKCGCIVNQQAYNAAFNAAAPTTPTVSNNAKPDVPNAGFSVLSFFVPIFGIIYFFCEHKNTPVSCKRYLIWSIVSIVLSGLFFVAYMALVIVLSVYYGS